ncbi:MAG: DNA-processing protein DprA [Patescibacteria group bacterium]
MRLYYHLWNVAVSLTPRRLKLLQNEFGNLKEAWRRAGKATIRALDVEEARIDEIVTRIREIDPARQEEFLKKNGIDFVTQDEDTYPSILREIHGPPAMLYWKGARPDFERPCVAIVGTRMPTEYGREVTAHFASRLAESGFTVVSGFAEGVDQAAHSAALLAGGETIGVLGSGLQKIYPENDRELLHDMCTRGTLISEFSPDMDSMPFNFPIRNRIISGLCLGVLVIEAQAKSGALITAKLAIEHNREIFAVPGSIKSPKSDGTNALIQKSEAMLVTRPDEIIDVLRERVPVTYEINGSDDEKKLLDLMNQRPKPIDELIRESGLSPAKVNAILATLVLQDRVKQKGGGLYSLPRPRCVTSHDTPHLEL